MSKEQAMSTSLTKAGALPAQFITRAMQAAGAAAAWLFTPAPKRPLTRGEEAEQVREFARSVRAHDRGFADDLFAAAARHEGREEWDPSAP
jgi:hypothetical protein